MDPVAGVLSFGGGLLQNMFGQQSAKDQMFFQQHMRDTAYRAGMKDMKLAGLNPILAYQKGPASAPAGAGYAATDPITPAVSSAMAAHRLKYEVDNMKQTNSNLAETEKLIQSQVMETLAKVANISSQTELNRQSLEIGSSAAAAARTDKTFQESTIGKILRHLGTGLREVNPFNDRVTTPSRR